MKKVITVLISLFSATDTTEGVAEHIANGLNADIYEIVLEEPYSEIETNVLGVYRDDIPECQETINNWLEEIGY